MREVILDKGREVHKVIETQVMGDLEEVIVEANSDEEKWALRVINLIVGLVMLLETGRTVSLISSHSNHQRNLRANLVLDIERAPSFWFDRPIFGHGSNRRGRSQGAPSTATPIITSCITSNPNFIISTFITQSC